MSENCEKLDENKKLVILLMMDKENDMAESVFSQVRQAFCDEEVTLSSFKVSDWDGDFSPWQYNMTEGRCFAGNGKETLSKIEREFYDVCGKYTRVFIAGYSLAGLFSLWAIHESDMFDGCACCSGSLWFEGWEEYSDTHMLRKPGLVYLSLGGKEDKTKDPVISTIGERIRNEDKRLDKDENVKKHTLVMNPGGHFARPDKRLAQGICWLLKESVKQ